MGFKTITFNVAYNNHISRTNDILHKMCEQLHVSNAKNCTISLSFSHGISRLNSLNSTSTDSNSKVRMILLHASSLINRKNINTCCRSKVRDNAALPLFPILVIAKTRNTWCNSSVITFNAFYRTVTVSSCSILDRFIENNYQNAQASPQFTNSTSIILETRRSRLLYRVVVPTCVFTDSTQND